MEATEGKSERALDLLDLVQNHPAATDPNIQVLTRSLLADPEAELSPEVLTAGLERGKSLDPETVIKGPLEEAAQTDACTPAGNDG